MNPNQPVLTNRFAWDTPLSADEKTNILTAIADNVAKRGLSTPVILFLEIHRPLAPLGAQIAVALSPFIAVWLRRGAFDMQKYVEILRDPSNITELISLIEERTGTKH